MNTNSLIFFLFKMLFWVTKNVLEIGYLYNDTEQPRITLMFGTAYIYLNKSFFFKIFDNHVKIKQRYICIMYELV